jgi:hypothetical protein
MGNIDELELAADFSDLRGIDIPLQVHTSAYCDYNHLVFYILGLRLLGEGDLRGKQLYHQVGD